jgi:hypothetical protein
MPTIPGNAESEDLIKVDDFEVGDTLTVYEAAMVYAGRHPGGAFLSGETKSRTQNYGPASREEYESFMRQRTLRFDDEARPRQGLAWDIYIELQKRIGTGELNPVQSAYEKDGRLDPLRTTIRTAYLVTLADERDERPEYLAHLMPLPEARHKAEELKRAPDARIDAAIVRVYDSAKAENRKPPNINELGDAVLPLLKVQGYRATGKRIRERGENFKHLRGAVGVRHSPRKNK